MASGEIAICERMLSFPTVLADKYISTLASRVEKSANTEVKSTGVKGSTIEGVCVVVVSEPGANCWFITKVPTGIMNMPRHKLKALYPT